MMRLELVRMIVAALVHPTRGVNAKLPGVPRDEGDDLPAAIVAVYDITRDDHVVNRSEPPKIPCLYVIDEGPVAVDGEQMTGTYRDTAETVAVTIRYVAGGHDLAKAMNAGDYTLRAAQRSVMELMEQANEADQVRNYVELRFLRKVTYVPARETVGEAAVAGALILEFDLRDLAPLTNPS